MKLPIDVAIEVAYLVKRISKDDTTERNISTHTIAESIMKCYLLSDTIAWKKYMVGV